MISAFSVLATSILSVDAKAMNNSVYDKDILVTKDAYIYGPNDKRESFNSLKINKPYIVVKGKKLTNGYEYMYKNKKYSTTMGSYELVNLTKTKTNSVKEFNNNTSPVGMNRIEPSFSMDPELEYAISHFKSINKTKNFKDNIENIMKTVLEMELEYGGDSYDQGNLKKGNTKCLGFTWIVANLLNETDIPYRYVLNRKDILKPDKPGHIYLEVKDPESNWRKVECTFLTKLKDKNEIHKQAKIFTDIIMDKDSVEHITDEKYSYLVEDSKLSQSNEIYVSNEIVRGKKVNEVIYQIFSDWYTESVPVI